jgi:hypothetical protein
VHFCAGQVGVRLAEGLAVLTERLLSAMGVCVIVGALSTVNGRAGEFMAGLLYGDFSAKLSFINGRRLAVAHTVSETIGSYAGDHALLVVFGLVALVLLGLMLRPYPSV